MKLLALLLLTALCLPVHAARIVLIAGTKTHGADEHEYVKGVRLFKALLDRSGLKNVNTDVYYDGFPTDPHALDTADTIVFYSDGMQWLPWTWSAERIATIQRQIDRGCGFVQIHFSLYVPHQFAKESLDWDGGYVDYDGLQFASLPDHQYFTQKTFIADFTFPDAKHPVLNGVKPFRMEEEFYYKAMLAPGTVPLVRIPSLPEDPKTDSPAAKPEETTVAWAHTAANGSRSVGITFGHSYSNWQQADYRKFFLNAIVWTAHVPVPRDGVQSTAITNEDVDRAPGSTPAPNPSPLQPAPGVR